MDAIRNGTPLNDGYHGATSSMTAIMGRMATYSGAEVTWEEAINSKLELAPGLAELSLSCQAPVPANEEGDYPIAVPGSHQGLVTPSGVYVRPSRPESLAFESGSTRVTNGCLAPGPESAPLFGEVSAKAAVAA